MTLYTKIDGVPDFTSEDYREKTSDFCVLIPVINEGERIQKELNRAKAADIAGCADIVICDGGSTDGSLSETFLRQRDVTSFLVKRGSGRQGAQLRMGIYWALIHGYEGIITIDGNNKDSIEDIPAFIEKLKSGYAFVQGSRFVKGGHAVNTPPIRYLSVRLIHAPIISLTAGKHFTDTTNAYRAYSREYLEDPRVKPLRDIFITYELLAYLSVRASQLGYRTCEIPVTREYPAQGKVPTKIRGFQGNFELMKILLKNMNGAYKPEENLK